METKHPYKMAGPRPLFPTQPIDENAENFKKLERLEKMNASLDDVLFFVYAIGALLLCLGLIIFY